MIKSKAAGMPDERRRSGHVLKPYQGLTGEDTNLGLFYKARRKSKHRFGKGLDKSPPLFSGYQSKTKRGKKNFKPCS